MTCEQCTFSLEPAADCSPISSSHTNPSALSNGTPTPAKSCESEPQTDGFPACMCTRETFGCSIHPTGRAEWIASMRASLARTLAQPAVAQALARAHEAAFTAKCSASLTWFDRDSCSWKTSQRSLTTDWAPFSETWPRAGMTVAGHAYPLPSLAPRINETDGGFWQTPVADDAANRSAGKFNSRGEPKLSAEVKLWPTPHGFSKDGKSNGPSGNELGRAVNQSLWPTPNTRDGQQSGYADMQKLRARWQAGHQVQLVDMVRMWPTPTAHNAKEGGYPAEYERNTPTLAAQAGGSLNPTWVEWLMGWPLAWTALRHWATAKSRFKRRSVGSCAEGR